jgi:hypothetical protein
MKRIGIDIDGTLRNLDYNIEKYLSIDYPHRVKRFIQAKHDWNKLDLAFDGDRDAVCNWLYGSRAFHIFGQAPKMYPAVMDHLNALVKRAANTDDIELWISTVQREQSITATLFWLAKNGCRATNIRFYNSFNQKISAGFDYVVDDRPIVLVKAKEAGSVAIVVPHPYNTHLSEANGYHRLDYDGNKPIGLAGAAPLLGLDTYKIIEGV